MQYGHSFEVWKYDGTLCRMVLNIMSLERFSVMAHLKGKKKKCLNVTQNLFLTVFWHLFQVSNGLCPLYWSHRGRLCTHPDNKVSLLIKRGETNRGWCV